MPKLLHAGDRLSKLEYSINSRRVAVPIVAASQPILRELSENASSLAISMLFVEEYLVELWQSVQGG